jgi:DNA polymerase I
MIEDTILAIYLLDGGVTPQEDKKAKRKLEPLIERFFDVKLPTFKELTGGKGGFADLPIAAGSPYACKDADYALRLWHLLSPRLKAEHLQSVYEADRALVYPIVRIKRAGILADVATLRTLSAEFSQAVDDCFAKLQAIEPEINPASHRQLRALLYDKLGLPSTRQTKKGAARSTDKIPWRI